MCVGPVWVSQLYMYGPTFGSSVGSVNAMVNALVE